VGEGTAPEPVVAALSDDERSGAPAEAHEHASMP
jgi:hypothetical protein